LLEDNLVSVLQLFFLGLLPKHQWGDDSTPFSLVEFSL